jgi:hypothetical protein
MLQHTINAKDAIIISDLAAQVDKNVISKKSTYKKWRVMDYKTADFAGTMLQAGENTNADDLTIELKHQGTYAIAIGIYSPWSHMPTALKIALDNDSAFSIVEHKSPPPSGTEVPKYMLYDCMWKVAELSGKNSITIKQIRTPRSLIIDGEVRPICQQAIIAYIKLIPVDAERQPAPNEQAGLYAHHDAWSYTIRLRDADADDIRTEIEPIRGSNFSRLYWECGMGDRMMYPTKLGLQASDEWIDDPYRDLDLIAAKNWQRYKEQGVNQLQVATEHCHDTGAEIHATYRPGGFYFQPPIDEWTAGGFLENHPHLNCQDKNGNIITRLSFAFEESQDFVIKLLEEVMQYDIDGICIAYNRRCPLMMYEKPLVDSFIAEYDEDPRELADDDPRWLEHRCKFLTTFMTKLRNKADEISAARNRKRLTISAIVLATEAENIFNAIDLRT